MIGKYIIIGNTGYLQINNKGTLQKLPRLKWWWQLYFLIKTAVKGCVHQSEILEKSGRK